MELIFEILVSPLQSIYELLFKFSYSVTHGYFSALILLSVITSILMTPLNRWASHYVNLEKDIQSVIHPQLIAIKKQYNGAIRQSAIARLYKRYSYNPLYSIRQALGILIQLPLLVGAYWMLESNSDLKGVSFGLIKDLSKPDALLWGLNLLPFVMIFINFAIIWLNKDFSKKERIQPVIIAIIFLILLYPAASALLIYWTCNNLISLLKTITKYFNIYYFIRNWVLNKYLKPSEKEFIKNDWKSLIFLSVISPACYLWFRNIGFFSLKAISQSLFILVIICGLIVLLLGILKPIFGKTSKSKIIFIQIILLIAVLFFYSAVLEIIPNSKKIVFILLITVSALTLYFLGKIKLINILLFIQMAVVSINGIIFSLYNSYEFEKKSEIFNTAHFNIDKSFLLNKTPNIYYILLESTHSFDVAVNVFGVSKEYVDRFKSDMEKLGFDLPSNIYSNSSSTLGTLYNIFSMSSQAIGLTGENDLESIGKSLIAGDYNNNLCKILKYNNYYISHYLQGNTYYYTKKGPLVDFSDIDIPYGGESDPLKHIHGIFNKIEDKLVNKIYNNIQNKVLLDSREVIDFYLENIPQYPHMFFHRMAYVEHSPSQNYNYEKYKDWLETSYYKNNYIRQLEGIKYFANKIVKKDPEAIIIFLGDHGSWLYRDYSKSDNELQKILNEVKITNNDFFDDKFKVLSAVRIPKIYGNLLGTYSPANIFAKIFNMIGFKNEKILYESPNDSYFMEKLVIKDGKFVGYF